MTQHELSRTPLPAQKSPLPYACWLLFDEYMLVVAIAALPLAGWLVISLVLFFFAMPVQSDRRRRLITLPTHLPPHMHPVCDCQDAR